MRRATGWAGLVCILTCGCGQGKSGPAPAFEDVTEAALLGPYGHANGGFGQAWAPEIVGGGGGFLDYDGDGWPDILLIAGGAFDGRSGRSSLELFRNQADGTFRNVTAEAGLAGITTYALGLAVGDYDNDGDEDVAVTTLYEDLFLVNRGGTFDEAGAAVGIADVSEWSTSALFFDADRDGFLDLYVATYVDWSPEKDLYCGFEGEKVYCTPELYEGIWGRYYHNAGDGTFIERTEEAGFRSGIEAARDKSLGVAELDANADGWPDLVIANDTERDLLFINQGDGTFVEEGIRSGVAYDQHGKPRAGMGVDVGVVDSTGAPTIFVGNFSDEMVGVYQRGKNHLFTDRAASSRIGQPSQKTLTFGLVLFDVDLDGDLDLFIANGHVQTHIARIVDGISFRQRSQLFYNGGGGIFEEAPSEGVLAVPMVARGAAYGDYDRDGDLDLLVVENDGPVHLWRNNAEGGTSLRVRLEGRTSNRNGYGASVEVLVDGRRQYRRVRSGSSYLAHSESAAVFGLAGAASVEGIWVRWPSGIVDHVASAASGAEIVVVEGSTLQ